MAYLRTVLTYHLPSEAEVDKTLLESHGIEVCLLNANTSRNELGAPFYIRLQVNDEDYAEAVALLKAVNPARFGSAENVAAIERSIKRALVRFALTALVTGVLAYLALAVLARRPSVEFQAKLAIGIGFVAGTLAMLLVKSDEPVKPSA
jgi:hypothetical protein